MGHAWLTIHWLLFQKWYRYFEKGVDISSFCSTFNKRFVVSFSLVLVVLVVLFRYRLYFRAPVTYWTMCKACCYFRRAVVTIHCFRGNAFSVYNTIINCLIFWGFLMLYQTFHSPQVKRCAIITYKHGIYQLPHELSNELRLTT